MASTAATVAPGPQDQLPTRLKLVHGFGSIAYGVKDNGFSTFLLLFYNQVIGLDATAVSFALMLALILDAFIDPFIGHFSDRTYTKWGRRLPWLYIAPIPLAICWILLWVPPESFSTTEILVYLVVISILVRSLVSCCEVPSVALIPELTRDYDERTSIMRYRYLFGWAGGLLVLYLAYAVFLVPTEEIKDGILNPDGYLAYGIFGGVLMAAAVMLSALGQHKRVAHYPASRPPKITVGQMLSEMKESLSNKAFLILMGAGAIAFTSQGLTFSITNFLFLYVWRFDTLALQIYPIVLLFSAILAFLMVGPLNLRFGKRTSAVGAGILALILWTTPFLLRLAGYWPPVGEPLSTGLVYFFAWAATSLSITVMITSSSMIADIVEASEVETGRRTEGLFYAGNMFMQKCATGVGIFLTGLIVAWAGLSQKTAPDAVAPMVVDRLTIAYCIVITITAISSAYIFTRFPISREDHQARVAALAGATDQSPD